MIKFIECLVPLDKQEAFSVAQRCWRQTSHCPGFIKQYGGWDQKTGRAIILAHWQNRAAIDEFMATTHDKIAEENQQHLTYESCKVSYFNLVNIMPSTKVANVSEVGFVRVADCKLNPGGAPAFLQDQAEIWTPAMSECDGMLGGYLAQLVTDPLRYMVISLWRDELSHSDYMKLQFKYARAKVNLESYIDELVGYQLSTIPAWDIDSLERKTNTRFSTRCL
ncbi:YdbC family protein [Shewanella eurypsychrophilus]|uniref:YdbC family protein n=1 Tax=Shewanella eurypsychrophilus TaxID=2593656 RepID=A0ABX6V5X0_9GAMM|nr:MULTISPECIES: YdbC family protein [Shewanella]QFU21938.1 DUF4937 domain-containing protein [Shewanella sp. YLB-09]QPG57227.1 YdbC family protein [Shewanella eurypsychrophilus]